MDLATHAIASFALSRGFFPRQPRSVLAAILIAGILADIDLLSALFGPAAYFHGRHTYTHSILGFLLVVAIAAVIAFLAGGKKKEQIRIILVAAAVAAALHLAFDLCGSDGITLLWPFRATRFAADWLPGIDGWILALLLAGILLPELLRLVTSEIGVKNKAPRGRNGAIVALICVVAYIGVRAALHGSAVNQIDAHTYHGEVPQRSGAFAANSSPAVLRGVVVTASYDCVLTVPVFGASFDPEAAVCWHKPEDSPALAAAQRTAVVKQFLQATQFPRAGLARLDTNYLVLLRDMRDAAQERTSHRVAAVVSLDAKSQVQSEQFMWANELPMR